MDSLRSTSSTDAISSSSASLMMIAHQFFQQQQHHSPHQQQQPTPDVWEQQWNGGFEAGELVDVEEEEEIDVGVYLDGFSPRPSQQPPSSKSTVVKQQQQQQSGGDWMMDCLMMSSCVSDPSECSSDLIGEEMLWRPVQSSSSSGDHIHQEQQGFEERQTQVIQLIDLCTEEMKAGDIENARQRLAGLKSLASPTGDAVQKTAFYFAEALESRLIASAAFDQCQGESSFEDLLDNIECDSKVDREDQGDDDRCEEEGDESLAVAYKALNDACPYLKFAHLTANQALLEATDGAARIHIVDFGTMQGVQWAAFLQAFATWPTASGTAGERRSVRITGIPSPHLGPRPAAAMLATRRRLTDFAALLAVDFDFCPLLEPLRHSEQVRVEAGEVVAVNLLVQLADLPAAALRAAFTLVERLNPRIVTVAEYEVGEGAGSRARFYCAVFDSMDASVPRDDALRVRAERRVLGREIWRSVNNRQDQEDSSEWQRRIIGTAGLWSAPLSHYSISQARLLLWLYNKSDSFSLLQAPGSLTLAWRGTNIVTVSTWHC